MDPPTVRAMLWYAPAEMAVILLSAVSELGSRRPILVAVGIVTGLFTAIPSAMFCNDE
jgi:hypothetical protein